MVPIGVSPEELTEFERKYRVILPESMREFYLSANGNADYLLWCWAYAIFLSDDPAAACPVYIVSGDKKRVVADSFLEFMQKCALDSKDLY